MGEASAEALAAGLHRVPAGHEGAAADQFIARVGALAKVDAEIVRAEAAQ